MSTTAQWVFDKAIYLMDEQSESSGATETPDTREYRHRTLGILNVLRNELIPVSVKKPWPEDSGRPICPELLSFQDEILLDDAVAQTVLPYGLAAHLLLGENDTMANYFAQRYMELFTQMRQSLPAFFEDIPRAYGGFDL